MSLSTATSVQNRGTFYAANTALKSGNSSRDRQSGSDAGYMPYQQGDQMAFQATAPLPSLQATEIHPLYLLVYRLLNLDVKLIGALIATLFFGASVQGIGNMPLVTLLASPVFFFIWYVMSYFDFQRAYQNALNGPRQARHHQQVPVTF